MWGYHAWLALALVLTEVALESLSAVQSRAEQSRAEQSRAVQPLRYIVWLGGLTKKAPTSFWCLAVQYLTRAQSGLSEKQSCAIILYSSDRNLLYDSDSHHGQSPKVPSVL
ncbi:hypothetical protein DL98DRAFT_519064 [Cadophora sp. DSE1049]|nr:hypothetical protein DL98DRAFT_519064 [Cadophora sp. DSE1049]